MGSWSDWKKFGGGVIDLGTAQSFDIKTLAPDVDYTKLTIDNFIVCCTNATYSFNRGGSKDSGSATVTCVKSYDESTGILTAYTHIAYQYKWYDNDPNYSGNGSFAVQAYLIN